MFYDDGSGLWGRAVRNDRDVYNIEQEKWELIQTHRPELIELIDRLFELKDAIATSGLDYALRGYNLPSIGRGKSFEEYMDDLAKQDTTMLLNEICMTNQQRWNHAKEALPTEVIEQLREMFAIIEQLRKVGIDYEAVANNQQTRHFPLIGENEKEINRPRFQLL